MGVLITGASGKIGQKLAVHFLKKGKDVIAHYNQNPPQLSDLVAASKIGNAKFDIIQANLQIQHEPTKMLNNIIAGSNINCIIHCACEMLQDSIENSNIFNIQAHFNLNLFSLIEMSQYIKQHELQCDIICMLDSNISDNTKHFSYTAAKKSVHAIIPLLANQLLGHGRINAIAIPIITDLRHDKIIASRLKTGQMQDVINGIEYIIASNANITILNI